MDKILISDVECVNDLDGDLPSSFLVQVTPQLRRSIHTLSTVVKDNQAYAIETFYHGGIWSQARPEDILPEQDIDLSIITKYLGEPGFRVDVPTLIVQKREFYFTAVPHGQGDDMALRTQSFKINVLDQPFKVAQVTNGETLQI